MTNAILTENDVVKILIDYFKKQGDKIISSCTTQQKGHDLVIQKKDGTELIIEAKGDTSSMINSKRYGQPFSGNQIWNHIAVGLLKTLVTLNENEGNNKQFGLAVPESHRKAMLWIKPSLDKLGIIVFIISLNGVNIL